MSKKQMTGPGKVYNIIGKQNFVRTMLRGLDRKMIDQTDLVMGVYNIYASAVKHGVFRCLEESCETDLKRLDSRIVGAVEKDGTLYTLNQLPRETAMLIAETNQSVIRCEKHDLTALLVESGPEEKGALVVPIMPLLAANKNHIGGDKPKKTPPKK